MKKVFLVFVLILGLILRFYRLGEIPPGFHKDEAFLGYNAYSILKTANDINGNFLPLHLQSFLNSPAGYSYFSIPPIAIFGLSPFSVRFASALFGGLSILALYFLVNEAFFNPYWALTSAFLLAISPWHLNLSRTATENVLVLFFLILGLSFWFSWLKNKKSLSFILSFLFFAFTLFLYQAPRAFLPLFLPVLFIISSLKYGLGKKDLFRFIGFFLLLIVFPLLLILTSRSLSLRIRTVSIFSTEGTQLVINQMIREDGVSHLPILISRLFHNKPFAYLAQFLENYSNHFSYDFLFSDKGFPDRYRIPLMGLFNILELPFLLIGLWYLFSLKKSQNLVMISWLILAPVGSALTFDDVPNLQRTLIILPAFLVAISFGIIQFFSWAKKNIILKLFSLLLILSFIYYSLFYFHQYYVHAPVYRPWYRNDGYKELVKTVNQLLPNYQKAEITTYESSPTIFFLFFSKYDPATFQEQTKNATSDFDRISFGKYIFSTEQCPLRIVKNERGEILLNGEKGTLYVNSSLCKIPPNVQMIKEIKRGDNSSVFQILELSK